VGDAKRRKKMTINEFLLFVAMLLWSIYGYFVNREAGDDISVWISFFVILSGIAGMGYLLISAL